jgi:hypothetical protein
MNLPTGVSRVAGKNVKSFEPKQALEELAQSNFSGYIAESLIGSFGLEEFALLFRNGQGMGVVYEYYGAHCTLNGDAALPHALNGFLAESGVLDIVELSPQQVDLVTAFNASLKLTKPIQKGQFKSLIKDRFDSGLSQAIGTPVQSNEPASKESLFKKFGLAGINGN